MKKYLLVITVCAAAFFAQIAVAQTLPNAQIEYAETRQDAETTRLAMVLAAIDKQAALTRLAIDKIGAGGYAQPAPAPVVQVAAARSGWDVLSGLFDRALGATAIIAPVYAQYRTGQAQAAASIKMAEYGRDTQIATFGAFERTAGAGFASNVGIARAGADAVSAGNAQWVGALTTLAARPSSVTNIATVGNGNNVATGGSTITANKNCTTGAGGNGGNSGNTTPASAPTIGTATLPLPSGAGGIGGVSGAASGCN